MSTGWIKLHRQLLDWEWYSDINVTRLFLHLMLKANHKDKKYRGTTIKRGQLLTGRELLSSETGLSEQQIRTCLTKLKSTSDVTIKSTSKGTLLTVDNYSVYQGCDDVSTSKSTSTLTNEQPTDNQRVTTNKNDKNVNNVKEVIDHLNLVTNSKYKTSTKSHIENISARLNDGHSVDDLKAVINSKSAEWLNDKAMAQYLRPSTLFQASKFQGYLLSAKPVKSTFSPREFSQ